MRRHGCTWTIALVLAGFWLTGAPVFANFVLARLETAPIVTTTALNQGQAIVILGGGTRRGAPEYGDDTVSDYTLERLRYGARLARATGLPVAVSGGSPHGGQAEARTMRSALRDDFGITVRWSEDRSRNTWQNAVLLRAMLPPDIRRVVLVTHAWHMPRACYAFEHAGFSPIAAPTGYVARRPLRWEDFMPGPRGWSATWLTVHEMLGMIWYRLSGPAHLASVDLLLHQSR